MSYATNEVNDYLKASIEQLNINEQYKMHKQQDEDYNRKLLDQINYTSIIMKRRLDKIATKRDQGCQELFNKQP